MQDTLKRKRIEQLLLLSGVPSNSRGFRCLLEGIELVFDAPDIYLKSMQKDLYPEIIDRMKGSTRRKTSCAFDIKKLYGKRK